MVTADKQVKFEALVTQICKERNLARFQAIAFLVAKGIDPATI